MKKAKLNENNSLLMCTVDEKHSPQE